MCDFVDIDINGSTYQLPVVNGIYSNNKAINISKLVENTGFITFDPGFKNTGITKSSISFIDGEKGKLLYRGYPIEQIIEKCSFIETCYLILNGDIPNSKQLEFFSQKIKKFNFLHPKFYEIINQIPNFYHPMGFLSFLTHIMTAFTKSNLIEGNDIYIDLLSKFPLLVALIYRKKIGIPPILSDTNIYYTSNLLKMFFSVSNKLYHHNPIIEDALDKLLILHADHEQNCSTTTVRLLGSAHVGLFSSISSGINALWGKRHGGANQAVIEMLEIMLQNGSNINKWINKAKNKKDPFRLMGFGHRIYKNFDPRAVIAKKVAEKLIDKLGIHDPILELAKKLEETALQDSYFQEKKLYPNIDFYSGIIYQSIGIPKEMFTVMFALGRLPGWIAHWREMKKNNDPIGRPRQIYIGYKKRNIDKSN
ncbi:citrate synthase [Blattabacterium cuenoti]|uniref:citrate synthase n=1 Tax=Blattabacterium cuenoti TaxID=1653831 RepID=UPI00163CFAC4|nr:citrate synthase [Blattabacterium cuenoti]